MCKKLLVYLCIAALLTGIVSGCSNNAAGDTNVSTPATETTPEEPSQQSDQPELSALTAEQEELLSIIPEGDLLTFVSLPLAEEKETLSLFLGVHSMLLTMYDDLSQVPFYAALEEQTGVTINFTAISSMAMDDATLSLMVAAGELTDMGSFGSALTQGMDGAIEDEFIIDLQDYFYAMPNYSALIENDARFRKAVTTIEGHIPGAQQYTMHNAAIYRQGLQIRADWLDDLGLSSPETIDELYNVLTRFKTEKGAEAAYDLGTNGGAFYGTTGMGAGDTFLSRAYGTAGGDFRMDENGNVQCGWLLDGFKEYLREMNKWYTEGLIASDFYSAERGMSDWTNVANNVNGVIATFASEMEEIKAVAKDDSFDLMAIVDPVLNKGDKLEIETKFIEASPNGGYNVSTNCKNPELACKWLDYLFSPNGWVLCNYGIEGESFNYGEDGLPQWTELITNPVDIPSGVAKSMYMIVQGPCLMYSPREFDAYTNAMVEASDIWASNIADTTFEYPNTITLIGADAEEYSNLLSDIGTYVEENAVRFIIGELNFQDDYDNFTSVINSMNMERILEIKQDAYDIYIGKK